MEKASDIEIQEVRTVALPWAVCLSASLFFLYQFMQMNAFNTLSTPLVQTFALNNIQLGKFSATYLLGLSLFFFPAGLLLDRFSTRKLMLIAMFVSIFCTMVFSKTLSLNVAEISRFILGMAHAMAFLGCFRLATLWLPQRLALIMGLIVTIGLLGGVIAQTPLALLTQALGWRNTVLTSSILGIVIWIIMYLFIQDFPENKINTISAKPFPENFFFNVKKVFSNLQNWLCSLYTCLLNLPIMLLGALWGNLYLTHEEHLTILQASTITTMLYVGTMMGSPLIGWLSDRFYQRKLFMILGAVFAFLFSLLALMPSLTFNILITLFLLLGILTSTQILSYPIITANNPRELASTAMGFASVLIMGGGAILQPIFGWLIEQNWQQLMPKSYFDNYRIAFLLLPTAFFISLLLSFFIRENSHSSPIP